MTNCASRRQRQTSNTRRGTIWSKPTVSCWKSVTKEIDALRNYKLDWVKRAMSWVEQSRLRLARLKRLSNSSHRLGFWVESLRKLHKLWSRIMKRLVTWINSWLRLRSSHLEHWSLILSSNRCSVKPQSVVNGQSLGLQRRLCAIECSSTSQPSVKHLTLLGARLAFKRPHCPTRPDRLMKKILR